MSEPEIERASWRLAGTQLDLIFFIERLSTKSIEVESLKVGVFRNINAIYDTFFQISVA